MLKISPALIHEAGAGALSDIEEASGIVVSVNTAIAVENSNEEGAAREASPYPW